MRPDPSPDRHSFVIRIWQDRNTSDWRGWVQHVPSGESAPVCGVDELIAFIERHTGKLKTVTKSFIK